MGQEVFLKIVVSVCSGALSLALTATLLFRRLDRSVPFFVAYISFDAASEFLAAATMRYLPKDYAAVWLGLCAIDLALYFCCLAEVARNLLRRNRAMGTDWLILPAFLAAGAALVLWPIVRWPHLPAGLPLVFDLDLRMEQARTILSVAGMLALLVWSNAFKFRWPERETRIVTGMSVWVLVSLAVLIAYTNGEIGHRYYWLDLLTPIAYIGVALYWLHFFWLHPSAGEGIGAGAVLIRARSGARSGDAFTGSGLAREPLIPAE